MLECFLYDRHIYYSAGASREQESSNVYQLRLQHVVGTLFVIGVLGYKPRSGQFPKARFVYYPQYASYLRILQDTDWASQSSVPAIVTACPASGRNP